MEQDYTGLTAEKDVLDDAGSGEHLLGQWSFGSFKGQKMSPGEDLGDSEFQELTLGLNTSNSDFSPLPSSSRKRRAVATPASYCEEFVSYESGWTHDDDGLWISASLQDDSEPGSSTETPGTSAFRRRYASPASDGWVSEEGRGSRVAGSSGKFTSFTKKNYCYVCGKGECKITRHFAKHADEEPDIAEALALPKRSLKRRRLLEKLRNKGNYKHNQEVLRNKTGPLKVYRLPVASQKEANAFKPCPYCKRMFGHSVTWKHVARCAQDMATSAASGDARILDENILEDPELEQKTPPGVKTILSAMKQDELVVVIRHDSSLIQLAQSLLDKHGDDPSRRDYVQRKLRDMGRLLLELQKKSIFSFKDAVHPRNFLKVVSCVKRIAGFSLVTTRYKQPGLARGLGKSLRKICGLVLAGAEDEKTTVSDARVFLELCEKEWSDQKLSGPSTVPFTRDVQAFYKYLEKLSGSAVESLRSHESPEAYTTLCRVTLARASVLNKRVHEVSKMTLRSFQERADTTRVLSKHFIRINITSKTGQSTAVLLTSQLVDVLTLLVGKRCTCNVHRDNPFLFAKPDSSESSHYHGETCIRSFSRFCRAKNPEHLRSMRFHKHIARIFQILHLENDELDHLAKLLGHNIRADRDYYRSPAAAVELAKIAKLLLAMEKGSLERFRGNSLEEVEIEDELEPDVEHHSPGNADGELNLLLQQSDEADQRGRRLTPEQDALEHIKAGKDKRFLQEKFIDPFKGRGLFTSESIDPSSFVVEYRGNIFPYEENRGRRCGYALNNYLFRFWWNGTEWRVDASEEDGTLGRLVNDEQTSPNCRVKKIIYKKKPHLCLFALKEITPGEEITFDYGNSCFPWRSQKTCEEDDASETDLNAASSSLMDEMVEDAVEISSYAESSDEFVCDEEADTECSFSEFEDVDDPFLNQENGHISDSDESGLDAPPKHFKSTKGNYCYVCGKPQSKISRHLFTHRKDEAEIAEAFALRRNSKERKQLLEKLRKRGNNMYNQQVMKTGRGQLKLNKQRDRVTLDATAVCIYCKQMYTRKGFWRHMQKCTLKVSDPPAGVEIKILALVATRLMDPHHVTSEARKILKKLKGDEIGATVLKDPYLLQLAQCLYYMTAGKTQSAHINRNLRKLGGLLLILREKSIFSFDDAMKPQNFSSVLEAVRRLGNNAEEVKFKRHVAMMGNLLKKLAAIKYARALIDEADKETLQEAEEYIKLCTKEWRTPVPLQSKVPNQPTTAFIRDVQVLYKYTENSVSSAVRTLGRYQSAPVYTALLRGVVAFVSALNKNTGRLSEVTLRSFQERTEAEPQEDAALGQSPFQQILSRCTLKIDVATQKGGKASYLLTPDLLCAIKLLVDKRGVCGVSEDNPYLFGRPDGSSSSIYRKHANFLTFVSRCGAQGQEGLKSVFFRKRLAVIFQILILGNDELCELGKLLGRDIRTEREYYQTPEAAADIAKIVELLLALKTRSLERYEGKSLEEVEIPDVLPPDEQDSEAEDEDTENSSQTPDQRTDVESGVTSLDESTSTSSGQSRRMSARNRDKQSPVKRSWTPEECAAVEKRLRAFIEVAQVPGSSTSRGFFSSTKRRSKGASGKKQDGSMKKSRENMRSAAANTENEDQPEETPANRPNQRKSQRKKMEVDVSFSDDDEDMNFSVSSDTDDDDYRNEENGADSDSDGSDSEETTSELINYKRKKKMSRNPVEEEEDGEQEDWMDGDSDGSSSSQREEKKHLSSAAMEIKEVKVLIPKLDMEKLQALLLTSQLSSPNNQAAKVQVRRDARSKSEATTTSTEAANEPGPAKVVNMICSHCKKSMTKGQTAFQKKGFTDVFCSKNCLFQMFPYNKSAVRTCHHCFKEILQPLDLIMAVVDPKGTMKDFCSPACLCSFKSNVSLKQKEKCLKRWSRTMSTQTPPSLCSRCKRTCATALELTLEEGIHSFCSETCLEGFCRDKLGVCENCGAVCRQKPLTLKLKGGAKTICGPECLEEFKEGTETPHQCTLCHNSQPVSKMVVHRSVENVVELFCSSSCVKSHKLLPVVLLKPGGNKNSTSAESEATARLIVATSDIRCCICRKRLMKDCPLYKLKNPREAFCSASCVSEKYPHAKFDTKKCHNCSKVIERPQNVILSPVDDTGTMMELCSEACLSSIKSKRRAAAKPPQPQGGPSSLCKMCAKYCYCPLRMSLNNEVHSLCSESCFINYHNINKIPCSRCGICNVVCPNKWLTVKLEDGTLSVCGDECLLKFKEKVETPQLCSTCRTPHELLDMMENKNHKGQVDFFCSYRCLMVDQAQSLSVSEKERSSLDGSNEVKPLLPGLDCLKEEPFDEEYGQSLADPVSPQSIKDEPKALKEELMINSVFSLVDDSRPSEPTQVDVPVSCSHCSKVLRDGETVYQRKGHAEILCSTPCLLTFYQLKSVKKTCHFCLRVIPKPQVVIQASVDDKGTKKDFCSKICLSSFNYKKIVSHKTPVKAVSMHSQCSMCTRYCISKHELIVHDVIYKICSDPCLHRFCNMNNLRVCESCHSSCSSWLTLKTADGDRTLCSAECLAQHKQEMETPQQCTACCASHLVSEMVENRNAEDVIELFCTYSCLMASKIQAASAAGASLNCDNCSKMTVPACHLAMPDTSVRNFCTLTCAMAFKERQRELIPPTNPSPNKTPSDPDRPLEKFLCAECGQTIKSAPRVVQTKERLAFVCSLACSQEFKRINSISSVCEYCKTQRVIHEVKRIDDKDCCFCSDGCRMLFGNELEIRWGKHCRCCAFCLSVSRNVVTNQEKGSSEEFCSEVCSSNYKKLINHEAECDACGRPGKLKQSLPLLGDTKHFCSLKCLLHFCNKKAHDVSAGSGSPGPPGPLMSMPIITNVISLSGAVAGQLHPSQRGAQLGPLTDVQTKVVGHASVQTLPKEVKNKSTLCVPLVHNKGVSCSVQTVEAGQQTGQQTGENTHQDKSEEEVRPRTSVLPVPVPVPVFVPVPMNMYSQYTPELLALPIPLPVPIILSGSEPTETPVEEKVPTESTESSSETDGQERREDGGTEDDSQKAQSAPDLISSQTSDLDSDHQPALNDQKDFNNGLSSQPQKRPKVPTPDPEPDPNPSGRSRSRQASQQLRGRVPKKSKGCELQLWSEAEEETSPGGLHRLTPRKPQKLKSQCGVDAWRKWVQWRESQTRLGSVSSPAVKLKADILRCSSAELNEGLCLFIAELRQPDGEPHPPDSLFYLCLSIQQYLFENGRVENIFSDRIYQKFSSEFTKVLKLFRPSLTAGGFVHSRVEEKFLWDCKQLGAYSPIVLLNTMLFFCCKYFGLTTVQQHRQLSFTNIRSCIRTNPDNSESTVVRFFLPASRSEAESDSEVVPRKKRKLNEREEDYLEITENTANPLRCPVRLFEFYLSKCSEAARRRSNVFYLLPDRSCAPNHPLWFSSTPLDDTTLEAMIVRTLIVRELQSDDRRGR